jgi:hypothetical protein
MIYKFRSLSGQGDEWVKQILFENKIYFSKYEELNDPFEYSYVWTTDHDLAKKVEFWSNHHEIYRDALAAKSSGEQQIFIEETEKNMAAPRGSKMIGADQVGIFCSSGLKDNHVLWSLYADSHRGVSIEFDPNEDEVLKKTHAVTYSDTPGEFNLYRGINHIDVMTKKFTDWTYERETRIFYNPGVYKFNQSALKSITFGVNAWWDKANREKVEEIIQLCKQHAPSIKIQRALKVDAAYKYRIETI